MVSNKKIQTVPFLLALFLAMGCKSNLFESEEALWKYLKDEKNGYHHKKSIKGVDYSLTYKPTDLMVAQELGKEYSLEDVKVLRKKYGAFLYFNLSISARGQELLNHKVGNRAAFGAMVNQLAFDMGEKVNLITQDRDTLPLLDYAYPRMYGMGTSTDMLFVYPREQKLGNLEHLLLTLEDLGLASGEITFKIKTNIINEEARLQF